MTNRVFRMINRFFEGASDAINTPSGYPHGEMKVDSKPRAMTDLEGSDALFENRR